MEAEGFWDLFQPASNPGPHDYNKVYIARGVVGHLDVSASGLPFVVSEGPFWQRLWSRGRWGLKSCLEKKAMQHAKEEEDQEACDVWLALMLGDRRRLKENWLERFQKTGTMHLFAVSGLHVGMVAGLALSLIGLATGRRGGKTRLLAAGVVFVYVVMTGCRPSAQRAALMFVLWVTADFVHRAPNSRLAAVWVFALLIFQCPDRMQDVGLQISFSVLWGLFFWTPILYGSAWRWPAPDAWKPRLLWRPWEKSAWRFNRWVRSGFSVSAAAYAGVLPWASALFGYTAPVSLILNLLVVPWASLILAYGLLVQGLAFFLPNPLMHVLFLFLWSMIKGLLHCVCAVSELNWVSFPMPVRGWDGFTLGAAAVLWLALPVLTGKVGHPWKVWMMSVFCAAGLLLWVPRTPPFKAVLFHTGNGSCIFLGDRRGSVLINGGSRHFGENVLVPFFKRWPVGQALSLVLTKNRMNHAGGLMETATPEGEGCLWVLDKRGRSKAAERLVQMEWKTVKHGIPSPPPPPLLRFWMSEEEGVMVHALNRLWWLPEGLPDKRGLKFAQKRADGFPLVVQVEVGELDKADVDALDLPFSPKEATCVLHINRFGDRSLGRDLEWFLKRRGWRVFRTDQSGAVILDQSGCMRGWKSEGR